MLNWQQVYLFGTIVNMTIQSNEISSSNNSLNSDWKKKR